MMNVIKIATLYLCLGLKNKKETVKKLIIDNEIEILCLQETEIPINYPIDLLTFRGYSFENENNQFKSRCGIYVSDKLSYLRRYDLEIINMHVMIIDIDDNQKTRIMNVYRPFNPQNAQTQRDFFDTQLAIIKNNLTENTIILGDFNLDQLKANDLTYSHKNYFAALNECFNPLYLLQMVTFETWSRTINNVVCSSTIDHIYVKDPTKINTIYPITPPFGDHSIIIAEIQIKKAPKADLYRRNGKITPL